MTRIVPTNAILIPQGAKRVFQGQIYDVYQWRQQMFDGSAATFEMLKRPDTVNIIGIRNGKIVGIRDEQPGRPPFVKLPGGRVEPGEDWLVAAKRECLEETGLEFATWRLVTVRQPIAKIEWFVATFVAFGLVSEHEPHHDVGERIDIFEMGLDEWRRALQAERSPLSDYVRELFDALYSIDQLQNVPSYQGRVVD